MAADSFYSINEIVVTSKISWEDASATAVKTASKTLRVVCVAEVVKLVMEVVEGKVSGYRARVALSFKFADKK